MTAEFQFEGDEEMMARFKRLIQAYPQAGLDGALEWAEDMMENSREQYSPVDIGNLKASGRVQEGAVKGGSIEISFGYPMEYAEVQHERRDFVHAIGQDHYLETPMILKSPELLPRIVIHMDRAAEEAMK